MLFMAAETRGRLADGVVRELKEAIRTGVHPEGSQLPTEAALCDRFGVSRPTVRAALKELEVVGLVHTRHGVGTFVRARPSVMDGLERMGSISESIRASGKEPSHDYARRTIRDVTPDEAERMGVSAGTEVLELRRRILADAQVVAYSYDIIPRSLLPVDFEPEQMDGSVFSYFETSLGLHATLGIAQVHAVDSTRVAWGSEAPHHRLFILLDQLHYTHDQRLLAYSRTYFVEGAYAFALVRRRA